MDVVRENIDKLNAKLKVTIAHSDYSPKLNESLKKYRKQVQLDGFRKGFVPEGLVRNMFGNSILAEELNRMAGESIDNYIRENSIDILGQPLPAENEKISVDVKQATDYHFTFDLGLSPDVALTFLDSKPSFEMKTIDVNEKLVDDEVMRLRSRYGKFTSPDDVQDKDLLYVDVVELDETGAAKAGGVFNSTTISADMIGDAEVKAKILSAKKGEAVKCNIRTVFDKEASQVAKHVLGIDENGLEAAGDLFEIRLNNISRMAPADLDEEFFKKVYPEKELNDEAGLRNQITDELKGYVLQLAKRKLYNRISEELIEKTSIEMPDAFLKRWIRLTNEKPITEEQVEQDYPGFVRSLKWNLIVNKLAKQYDVKVGDDDIQNYTRSTMYEMLSRYGIHQMTPEQEKNFMDNMLKDRQHLMRAHETIQSNKVLEQLSAQVTVTEKPVTEEEFYAQ